MSPDGDRIGFDRLRLGLVVGGAMLAALAYYRLTWSTFAEFAAALDHEDQLFGDFVYYYRPMGQRLFALKTAVAGFHYSAFFALLMVPLASLPFGAAMWVWGMAQAASVWGLVWRCSIATSRHRWMWQAAGAVVCVASFPVLHCFRWGQVSVMLTLCVIAALAAYSHGRRALAGVLLALATAVKFYPAMFALIFIWRRDRRALGAFAIGCVAALVVLPAVFLGPAAALRFIYDMSITQAGWIRGDANSQYVVHVVGRYLASWSGREPGEGVLTIVRWAGVAIAVVHVAMMRPVLRRSDANALPLAAILLFTTIPMLIPTSWPHYFVYLPWCQMVLLRTAIAPTANARFGSRLMIGLVLASILLASIWMFQAFGNWQRYNGGGMLLLTNVMLLPPLYGSITVASREL